MTVELIAKKTRRPLVRLSAADLGTEEVQMEKRLMKWLDRATIWGSIVLIDEAEVYLEQRQSRDISRNALVTAFLRTMEYFPGLLFLTSNGIGLFDEAVMSRIHLAVRYERPTDEQRINIWRTLFDKLERDQRREAEVKQHPNGPGEGLGRRVKPKIIIPSTTRDVVLGRSQYATNLQLNGRDIRNLLLSAISLAQFESLRKATTTGKPLTEIEVTASQLEKVLKNKEQFNDDYKGATGFYPDQLAAERFIRAETPKN
ncbi:ATPase family AAA domain-containing protein 3B [Madurella mycetomatis]|uniref:ATPase family AAA domain-containing protein 3B n=1 Tax=Madurella mycetomatis TaxID=100816 RepID=A0A175VUK9_9PEZI|nr:ATPase family AAA domain-containing protein 3B [Madurella mycetomatis]